MRKQQLALFLPSLVGGGAERIMLVLARELSRQGYSIDMVLARKKGDLLKEVPDSIRVVDLNASRDVFAVSRLARYIRQERPEVMLSFLRVASIVSLLARFISRRPLRLIAARHGVAGKTKNWKGRLIVPFLMKFLYPRADFVVAVSQGEKEDLLKRAPLRKDHVGVIYNPVVDDKLLEKAEEPADHPWLNSKEVPVILGVGRLTPQKNFTSLIRAFSLVYKKREARLIILGEGRERRKLEKLVSDLGLENSVSLPGFKENPYPYMKNADVFVLSSRWEGFGLVLVEAMACGTPVVSTDCPSGPAEILEREEWGRLVSPGDVKDMARAIQNTLKDKDPPAVKERSKQFSVDKAVEEYKKVLFLN